MSSLNEVDLTKTIEKNKIVYTSRLLETFESFVFYLLMSFIVCSIILLYKNFDSNSPNDSVFGYFILPLAIVFICWMIYKKLIEKRLLTIYTTLNKKEERKFVLEFAKTNGWSILMNNAQYLTATTDNGISYGKFVVIIYNENRILLNVMSNNPKIRRPVLISDILIKKQIEKALTHYINNPY